MQKTLALELTVDEAALLCQLVAIGVAATLDWKAEQITATLDAKIVYAAFGPPVHRPLAQKVSDLMSIVLAEKNIDAN